MFVFGSFPDDLSVVVLHQSEVNQARVSRQNGTITIVVNCQAAKYSMVIPIRPSDVYFERRMHDLEKFLKQEVFSGYMSKLGCSFTADFPFCLIFSEIIIPNKAIDKAIKEQMRPFWGRPAHSFRRRKITKWKEHGANTGRVLFANGRKLWARTRNQAQKGEYRTRVPNLSSS